MSSTPASKPAWKSPAVLIGGASAIILLIVGLMFASGAFKGKEEPTLTQQQTHVQEDGLLVVLFLLGKEKALGMKYNRDRKHVHQ